MLFRSAKRQAPICNDYYNNSIPKIGICQFKSRNFVLLTTQRAKDLFHIIYILYKTGAVKTASVQTADKPFAVCPNYSWEFEALTSSLNHTRRQMRRFQLYMRTLFNWQRIACLTDELSTACDMHFLVEYDMVKLNAFFNNAVLHYYRISDNGIFCNFNAS